MTKKRTGEPWMPADDYGRGLPAFSVNLIVRDVARSVEFYRNILGAKVQYLDADFAALELAGLNFMIHADHTYDQHAWHRQLSSGDSRGLGAELRLFHVDPDQIEARARAHSCRILQAAQDKPHGWRDVIVADPDGYAWAIGVPLGK